MQNIADNSAGAAARTMIVAERFRGLLRGIASQNRLSFDEWSAWLDMNKQLDELKRSHAEARRRGEET